LNAALNPYPPLVSGYAKASPDRTHNPAKLQRSRRVGEASRAAARVMQGVFVLTPPCASLCMDIEKFTERAQRLHPICAGTCLTFQPSGPETRTSSESSHRRRGRSRGAVDPCGRRPPRRCARADEIALAKLPKVEGSGSGQIYLAPETARLFDSAQELAKKSGDSFVTAELLLLRLRWRRGRMRRAFSEMPASSRRPSTRRSRICARAARPTARRPRTAMTRSRNMPAT
jgi:hypothetical protein